MKRAELALAEVSGPADEMLDRVFIALADPVRRRILARLNEAPSLVSELAAPFDISRQAVSRHIHVLVWINHYSKYWQEQFEMLVSMLEAVDGGRSAGPLRVTR